MRDAVFIEQGANCFGARVPDLPGCVAFAEVLQLIREAIEFRPKGLDESGEPIPPTNSHIEYVEVLAA